MSELINGRTPEDIKNELQWLIYGCPESEPECEDCIYSKICSSATEEDAPRSALALIERLESERDAALAKVPKWIGVKERLPLPETERYLVACILPDGNRTVHTAVWAWDENDEQGDWINWDVVTHWMPLPEPPKEGE